MLKWTASAQKLAQDATVTLYASDNTVKTTDALRCTKPKKRKRRATIANKENIPISASTPVVQRTRNSPLVLVPLVDILNVTPEAMTNRTPERRRVSINAFNYISTSTRTRKHSTVGFVAPQIPQYATTLPKYEEEYSPSNILPSGQQLALRGLLPDAFMGNPRYFTTPQLKSDQEPTLSHFSSLPKKRKLEQEFVAIAKQHEEDYSVESQSPCENKKDLNQTTASVSNKMGDQTLDHLIDDILDSARKEEKKRKPRKSFNLRRRTLLKNQVDQHADVVLSPSYTAGDDPCSDLSFLNCEPRTRNNNDHSSANKNASSIPATPQPATPPPGTPLAHKVLLQLPTPVQCNDSFSLDTPVRLRLKRKPQCNARPATAKKYKVDDGGNYLEIGVALPSIYV